MVVGLRFSPIRRILRCSERESSDCSESDDEDDEGEEGGDGEGILGGERFAGFDEFP